MPPPPPPPPVGRSVQFIQLSHSDSFFCHSPSLSSFSAAMKESLPPPAPSLPLSPLSSFDISHLVWTVCCCCCWPKPKSQAGTQRREEGDRWPTLHSHKQFFLTVLAKVRHSPETACTANIMNAPQALLLQFQFVYKLFFLEHLSAWLSASEQASKPASRRGLSVLPVQAYSTILPTKLESTILIRLPHATVTCFSLCCYPAWQKERPLAHKTC